MQSSDHLGKLPERPLASLDPSAPVFHPLPVRNRTVEPRLKLLTYAQPSQTPDPDLGVMVKHSFLIIQKDIFNISFNTFQTSWTTRRPRPLYHVSCFGLTIMFLILSFLSFLYYFSFINVTLRIHGPCMRHRPASLCLSY